jgi:hypothetical protein
MNKDKQLPFHQNIKNMNKKLILPLALLVAVLSFNAIKFEKDPLHGKKFETNATEFKDGAPKPGAKALPNEIEFKNGKLFSDLAASDKGGAFDQWLKYNIEKDSTYTEEDIEKHYYVVKASHENDDGVVISMEITIDDIEIEGVMKLTKNDRLKKHFEFVGHEKAKKQK